MATINYTLVRLIIETIPTYEGDKDMLEIFISACDSFHTKYYSQTDTEINQFIYQAILGKLKGNALLIIGSRSKLNTWPLIKEELRNTYGERLNLDNLEQTLMICSLQKNESYHNFAKRLQLIRSKLALKLKTIPSAEMNLITKEIHLKQYSNMALKIFVRNLDRRLRDKIIAQKPTDLEHAMALVQEDENFELFLQPQNYKQLVPKNNLQSRPHHPVTDQRPVQNYPQKQYSSPMRPFNQIPPNQFINRNQYQYPTNSQVFGRPLNVWQPGQHNNQNYSRPVPMSGVSTIPTNLSKNNPMHNNKMPINFRNPVAMNEMRSRPFHYAENKTNLVELENDSGNELHTTYTSENEYFANNSSDFYYNNENYDTAYDNLQDNECSVPADNLQEIDPRDFLQETQQTVTP